jgi:hypothetical protein
MLPEKPRQAPPLGRVLRILLGLVLIAYVAPVYLHVSLRLVIGSLLLMIGLIAPYSIILIASSRRIMPMLGAIAAQGLLIALFVAGGFGLPIVGGGKGQLAAVSFFGISLVVAGVGGLPGCELMAIPGVFFHGRAELACLIFSPLDKLEHKLRSKHHI